MAELVYRVGLENRSPERDRGFESYSLRKCSVRLTVRTPPFHGGDTGSIPGPATKKIWNFEKFFLSFLK